MKKIYFLSVALMLFYSTATFSQMEIPYMGYNQVPSIYNPASSVFAESFNFHGSYQNYWMGFENAPEALNFNIFGNIHDNMGVSLNLHRTNINIFNQTQVEGGYSYRVRLNQESQLAFGLSLGLRKISANQSTNPLDQFDPLLESDLFNQSHFSGGFGVSYLWKDLMVQAAAPHLYFNSDFFNKYIVMVSYTVNALEDFHFRPMVMYRNFTPVKDDFQLRLQATYLEQVHLEVGYGNDIHFMAGVGFSIGNVKLGYSYAILHPSYSSISSGTNSIYAIYSITRTQSRERIRYNLPLP